VQVLGVVKAKSAHGAEGAEGMAAPGTAEAVRVVLDDGKAVRGGEHQQLFHISCHPAVMDHHNSLGPFGEHRRDRDRVEIAGVAVDIGKDAGGTPQGH
jgi:hypothetical protein